MPDQDPAQTATDPVAQAAAGTTNPTPTTTTDPAQAAADIDALPAWAQQTIRDLRKEQASRRKAAQDAEAAAKAAEEKQLAERQEWQKLAEQRAAELASLTPVAERYAALSSEITAQIEAEIKTWPAEVIALRPADADAVALMTWAKTARPLAQKLTTAGQPPAPGQGQTPKPAGNASRADVNRQQAASAQVRSRF